MLSFTQFTPRMIWSVTTSATLANERVAGISGSANPIILNPNLTLGLLQFRVITKTDMTLNRIAVYGAITDATFPAAGVDAETLSLTLMDLAAGQGVIRALTARDADITLSPNKYPVGLIPGRLLLEYSTTIAGVAPVITFEVWGTFIGPLIGGTQ
jgi:hypothetical protein